MAQQFCMTCGASLGEKGMFCTSCGVKVKGSDPKESEVTVVSQRGKLLSYDQRRNLTAASGARAANDLESVMVNRASDFEQSAIALDLPGEMSFSQTFRNTVQASVKTVSPFSGFQMSLSRLFKGIKEVLTDKRRLIPLLLLTIIWIAMPIIKYFGIFNGTVYYLSVLTFAEGGLYNGVFGAIGGLFGKTMVAGMISQSSYALLSGKNPLAGTAKGLLKTMRQFINAGIKGYSKIAVGCGMALVFYNFMGSYTTPQSVMVGVSGLLFTLKAMDSKAGFIKAFADRCIKGKGDAGTKKDSNTSQLMAGLALGFGASVLLSATQVYYICYILGALMLLLGVALHFAPQTTGEEMRHEA